MKSSLKQYIRGKPNPWGRSGVLYDFDVYQGKTGRQTEDSISVGDTVLQMCKSLPDGKNYRIFADNFFFTSMPLLVKLKEKSFHYVGIVRAYRVILSNFQTVQTF